MIMRLIVSIICIAMVSHFLAAETIVAYRGADGTLRKRIIPDWPKVVEVEGVGETEDLAVKDGLLKAVQQATGFTIDAQQEVQNDSLVKDRIATASRGRVVSYDVTKKKTRKGLLYVTVRAKIDRIAPKKDPLKPKEEMATCSHCNGNRYVKFDITCTRCRGEGVMPVIWKRGVGGRPYKTGGGECPMCRGIGKMQRSKICEKCRGKGKVPLASLPAATGESAQDSSDDFTTKESEGFGHSSM